MRRSPRWLHFGPFRLDLQRCALWCGDERLSLRPQTATVLQYLAERPDQVISIEELLAQNWLDTHVSNTVLRVCIREIRHVLEDKANDPQYVQTVRGQGYRFCGHVETIIPSTTNDPTMATPSELIGREQLLSQCYNAFQRALSGQRQVLFISGEAGMGKTTVINAFFTGLEGTSRLCIAQGQCIELTGPVEAYMPMLEALSQLGLGADRERLISALYQAAPTWLTHLPMLVPNADREALQRQVQGSTRARMIRELVDAFDVFTAERPLVLVLEDLHWSDPSTIDLLAVLAHRRTPAHLLVLGSFRPLELQVQGHPLGRLLQMLEENDHRHELTLPPLNHAAVQAYVKTRLQAPAAFDVTNLLYERSAGNILLLARLLDTLLEKDWLEQVEGQWLLRNESAARQAIPEGIRPILERQLSHFPIDAQDALEVASIVGDQFTTSVVASVLQREQAEINAICEEITSTGHILRSRNLETWPDATISGAYQFQHALYRQVLYERLRDVTKLNYPNQHDNTLCSLYRRYPPWN